MKCPKCQTDNRRGARFCRQCDAMLGVACKSCGKFSMVGSRFCDACGLKLPGSESLQAVEPAPSPGPSRGQAGRYNTSPVLSAPTGTRALEGENKQVTVLFCDIVNSTTITEEIGPEATHELLDRFFDLVVPEITRFEGTVNQFLGDGFMALYGAPVAHEDHARRALLAALAIQRKLTPGIVLSGGRSVELVVRMGLNTGFVVIGRIGENLQMDYTAVGDTTVVAARLQQAAQPGDIQISDATRRAAAGLVQVESVGLLQLKGKSRPVIAWKVRGLERRVGNEQIDQRPLSPFTGRSREISALREALAEVEEGTGQVVGLVGEPGLGKTRLLHELTQGLEPGRATCFGGRCPPYGAASAFALVLDLLRGACGIVEGDDLQQIAGKITASLAEVGLDSQAVGAPLLQLLDTTHEVDPTTADTFKAKLFDVLTQMVLRASRRRTLILLLENLHWIDPASSQFLGVLAERLAGAPVLVVATYRPGYLPPWSGKSYASQIALRPLSTAQSESLAQSLLQGRQEKLLPALVAKAEGNPFFLEELARNAVEHADDDLVTVPDSVHGVITARIDRLHSSAKRTLQAAAVLGREFTVETLQRVVGPMAGLGEALDELVQSEFLFERVSLSGSEHVFRHALTQDVAYGMLLQGQRAHLHGVAGVALLEANRERPVAIAERLAYHFGLSDRDDEAVKFGLLAAVTAQRRWANEAALNYFNAVCRRLESMTDNEANRLLRIDTVIGQAEAMFALGRQAEHVQALEAIRPLVQQCNDDERRASWSYWTGFLHSFTGSRPEISIGYCRDAARIARDAGLEELQAYANCCLAHVSVLAGDLGAAMAAGEAALPVFEKLANTHWACRTLWGMSMAANAIGDWSRGLDICKRALDHGRATGDNRLIVVGWMRTGSTLIFQGRPREGMACCDSALALSPSPYDARMIRSIRAYGSLRAGDADAAVAALQDATGWFAQSKLQYTWTYFSLWLAEAYLRQGHRAEALELADKALEAARTHGYRHLEGLALRTVGESLIAEDASRARELLQQGRAVLAEVGARSDFAKTLVLLAGLLPQDGHALLERALEEFRDLGSLDETPRVEALLARNS